MHMVKAELRTAVDAASRAGTEVLTRTQDLDAAHAAAIDMAARNRVAGNGLTVAGSDVEIGHAEPNGNGAFDFQVGGSHLNSVRVVGRRDNTAPDGSVPLFFANLFGVGSFAPRLDSVSSASVRDIALVLDRSGSMATPLGGGTRLSALQQAVAVFLTEIQTNSPGAQLSLTTYSTNSTRDIPLTSNFASIVNRVGNLEASGMTNIFQGLRDGSDSLDQDSNRRSFADRTIVLMTDGIFNVGGTPIPSANLAAGRNHVIHTITFSSAANQDIMQQVAAIGGGIHLHADTAGDLTEAFREIARSLSVVLVK
jgi:uncharacterized protein YegL